MGGGGPPPPPPQAQTGASASNPLCIVANEGQTISVNPPANGYLKTPSVAWYARNDNYSPENYTQGNCNTYPTYSGAWGANTYVLDLITGNSRYGRKTVNGQGPRMILNPPLNFGLANCSGPNPSDPACTRANTFVASNSTYQNKDPWPYQAKQTGIKYEFGCKGGYYKTGNTCSLCPVGKSCAGDQASDNTCPAGTFSAGGAMSCSDCGAGTSSPGGMGFCITCPPGSFSGQARSSGCTTCPAGAYCTWPGTITPIKCAGNTYSTATGASLSATCLPCGQGQVPQNNANGYPTSCTGCPPGYISTAGSGTCSACPSGTYMRTPPGTNTRVCEPCPTGTFFAGTAGTSISVCTTPGSGLYAPTKTAAAQCPAGFSCSGNGLATPCQAGTWSPLGATTCTATGSGYYSGSQATSQTICPAGSRCPTTNASPIPCEAGTFSPAGQLTCSPCPAGKTSGTGAASCTTCAEGTFAQSTTQCTSCPAGSRCTGGIRSVCPIGTYSSTGASSCTSCPSGTTTETTGATSSSACKATYNIGSGSSVIPGICPAGYRCDGTSRTICPAGTFSPAGQPTCSTCPTGTYSANPGASTCTSVGSGYYVGSDTGGSQIPCPAGYRCAGGGTRTQCQAGTYSPEGAYTCTTCPSGTFSRAGAASCIAGASCPGGYYCTGTSITSCPSRYYCEEGTTINPAGDNSLLCPAGSYCPPGTSLPLKCASGSYCPDGSAFGTGKCPLGKYCPDSGYPMECLAGKHCPIGTETPLDCTLGNYCPAGSGNNTTLCPQGNYCPDPSEKKAVGANEVCVKKESIMSRGSGQRWGINDLKLCSTGEIAVSLCPDGYYKSGGICTACPAGSSCANGLRTLCPVGTYSATPGVTSCTPCEPGKVAATPGRTECITCQAAYPFSSFDYKLLGVQYRPYSFNGINCVALPSDPMGCTPGQYHNGSACVPCEPGKAATPVSTDFKANFTCTTCPAGTYTSAAGSATCIAVQAGHYSTAGATSQTKCPRGYYCDDGTGLKACPPGTYNSSEGSASFKPADAGYYSPGTIVPGSGSGSGVPAIDQIKCPRMFFSSTTGSTTCTPCPSGQYSEEGATACLSCPSGTIYDTTTKSCRTTSGTLNSGTRAVLLRNSGSSLTTLTVGSSVVRCLSASGSFTNNFTVSRIYYSGTTNTLYSSGSTSPARNGINSTSCERVS